MFFWQKVNKTWMLTKGHTALKAALFTALLATQTSNAVSEGQLFQDPAFLAAWKAVQDTNNAMKIAAMNPMDKWRRQAVRDAIQQIPPALIGLAQAFESGRLHDDDYQYVMGMLGGFVDQNSAPQIYSQFLKKPSMDLIPKAGQSVQARLDSATGTAGGKLYYDDKAAAPQEERFVGRSGPSVEPTPSMPANGEVVNLSAVDYASDRGQSSSNRLVYDETAAAPSGESFSGGRGAGASSAGTGKMEASSGQPGRSLASEVTPSVEAKPELSSTESKLTENEEESADGKVEKKDRKTKRSASPSSSKELKKDKPRSSLRPLNLQAHVLQFGLKVWSVFGHEAYANGGQGGPGGPDGQGGSNCKSCQGGGGGGGGEGGGGGGGQQAAQLLFGAAAIMAAIVPAIVAGQQADADKEIARTNAEAQKYMTDAVAANSEALAQMQQATAMYQTDAQVASVQASNAATTERLKMQLAQLESSQARIAAMEQQQFAAEQALNQERVQLSKEQLQANLAAAQAQQNLQITQAGLSIGSTPGDSGSTLTVAQTAVASNTSQATGLGGATAASGTNADAGAGSIGFTSSRNNGESRSFGAPGMGVAAGGSAAGTAAGTAAAGSDGSRAMTAAASGETSRAKPATDQFVHSDSGSSTSIASSSSGSSSGFSGASSSSFGSALSAPVAGTPADRLTFSGGIVTEASNFSRAVAGEPQVLAYLKKHKHLNGSTRAVRARESSEANTTATRYVADAGTQMRQAAAAVADAPVARGLASTGQAGHGHGGSVSAGRGIGARASTEEP